MLPLAGDPGFSFGDEFTLALVGFGIVLIAGIGALSHQEERAFSASVIYLALGVVAAGALSLLEVAPLDHVRDATLLEHVTELALIVAVFTTGMRSRRSRSSAGW